MADLIDSTRAKYNLGGTTINSSNLTTSANENTTLAALITACSKAIKKFCRREFDSQTFDELYDGNASVRLALKQFPIISVARVAYGPTTVLRITNTSTSNQRATVALGASGLSLVRAASGTVTTDTSIVWATYTTIATVAAAVNALGNGWAATIPDSQFNNWASADLRAVQGALNAKDVYADIRLHTNELSGYEIDQAKGIIYLDSWSDIVSFFDDCDVPNWGGGRHYWRVIYTAGFATVPEDVQEACAQWVSERFWLTKRDPGVMNTFASGTGTSYSEGLGVMPGSVQAMLGPYIKRTL